MLWSCTSTPPENADEIIPDESIGLNMIQGDESVNGSAFNEKDYTPSKGLAFALSGDKTYYSVSGIGSNSDDILVIPSQYQGKPVKSIADRAFMGKSFDSVVIPDSVTYIGERAFYLCRNLKEVIGGRGISVIDTEAFSGCSKMTEFTIYNALTQMSPDAFCSNYNLAKIKVVPDNALYASVNGDLYSKDGRVLVRYALGKQDSSYTIADSVTEIAPYAFEGAYRLNAVEFGSGVTRIGDAAFYGCFGLDEINLPDNVREIGSSAFGSCTALVSVNTGNGVKVIADGAFANCQRLRVAIVGNSAEELGSYLFYRCRRLRTAVIGSSADKIGAYSFGECTSLREIDLGGVRFIDSYAFYGCENLKSVDIPDSVTDIGYQAFCRCESLSDISFGSGLKTIGNYAFCRTAIGEITLPEGLISIGDSAFTVCENLIEIVIPDSVEYIGTYAFCGCTELQRVVLGKGLMFIGSSAFSECSGITDVAYRAGEGEFALIGISKYNTAITEAEIKFNYTE